MATSRGTYQAVNETTTSTSTKSWQSSLKISLLPAAKRRISLPWTQSTDGQRKWRPPALRPIVLIGSVLFCWSTIIILQLLLRRSDQNDGLIFALAPILYTIPIKDTFPYRYLPTLIAVLYSVFWSWIDLETKRIEPYYQLMKEEGALGRDSLLLDYPFNFLPLVPFRAFRNRHWAVFWSSTAMVIVAWGIVPSQAGIFTIKSIDKVIPRDFAVSTSQLPFTQQPRTLGNSFVNSIYAMALFNETLPPYMDTEYALAPFKPITIEDSSSGSWSCNTTLFSVDLICVEGQQSNSSRLNYWHDGHGCETNAGLSGLDLVDDFDTSIYEPNKQYSIKLVPNFNDNFDEYAFRINASAWSTPFLCSKENNHTFFASIVKNRGHLQDPPTRPTAMFCTPFYFSQTTSAIIDITTRTPTKVFSKGPKVQLKPDIFNTHHFEDVLGRTTRNLAFVTGEKMPVTNMLEYMKRLPSEVTTKSNGNDKRGSPLQVLPYLFTKRPFEDYLDLKVYTQIYERFYRASFARAMAEVLETSFETAEMVRGEVQRPLETFVLNPLFTHTVQVLLAIVSILTICLLFIETKRNSDLGYDPCTTAGIMSLIADKNRLLALFVSLDSLNAASITQAVNGKRFKIIHGNSSTSLEWIEEVDDQRLPTSRDSLLPHERDEISHPVRLIEFRLPVVGPLLLLFLVIAITIAVLDAKSSFRGLPIPSQNATVENILESFIPTAVATLIEPMWILFNRLLCLLQPWEQLRSTKAEAADSINADYSSLPPQITIWKALRSGHLLLATVCCMALLANVLAISFSGLFNQELQDFSSPANFSQHIRRHFIPEALNISDNGTAFDEQYLILDTNFSRNTPLPDWSDKQLAYMPFKIPAQNSSGEYFSARTPGIGATLECVHLSSSNYTITTLTDEDVYITSRPYDVPADYKLYAHIRDNNGRMQTCSIVVTLASPLDRYSFSGENGAVEDVHPNMDYFLAGGDINGSCADMVAFTWFRTTNGEFPDGMRNRTPTYFDDDNTLVVACQPRIVTGSAILKVNAVGRLLEPASDLQISTLSSNEAMNQVFGNLSNASEDWNNVPFGTPTFPSRARFFRTLNANSILIKWADGYQLHNDTSAANKFMFFVAKASGSTRILNPELPVPTFEDVHGPLVEAYERAVSIWLAINRDMLFQTYSSEDAPRIEGYIHWTSRRLFLSRAMVIISETILGIYIITIIVVYFRRPGQYLPRLPTNLANTITLFAASSAVTDMRGTSMLTKRERVEHLKRLDERYGYGSYVGTDGRVHIGIEKFPFVRPKIVETWIQRTFKV